MLKTSELSLSAPHYKFTPSADNIIKLVILEGEELKELPHNDVPFVFPALVHLGQLSGSSIHIGKSFHHERTHMTCASLELVLKVHLTSCPKTCSLEDLIR